MRRGSKDGTGLRHRLRPYQVEAGRAIARSVFQRQGHSISVMMARQAGKNELSAQLELLLLTAHMDWNVDAVKCAPTFQPQARISMRRLWSRLGDAGLAEVDWPGANLRDADLRGASFHLGSSRSGLVGSPIACEGSRTGFYTDDYHDQEVKYAIE
ncbi:MAG: pentapeptide repeat-containing protein, partial [Dehalococcoidia bacterium]